MNVALATINLEITSRAILGWVGQALVCGTALALVTWLLIRLPALRRRPALHGALWLIVLFKFLVPVGPSWSLSLASMAPDLTGVWPGSGEAPSEQAAEETTWPPLWSSPAGAGAPASVETAAEGWSLSITSVLAAAYVGGVLITVGLRLWKYGRTLVRCRKLERLNGPTRGLVAQACARLGARRVPEARLSDQAPTPFLIGLFRPMLVISPRQLARPDELEAVLLHEVAHLRRGDMAVRYLQWMAGTALFFWPVVAWVNRRIDLVREHACDQWALRYGRLARGDYARCLLRALPPARSEGWLYRPAAMAATRKTIERRIEMIMNSSAGRDRRAGLGLPALVGMLAWSAFVLTGAATAADEEPSQATEQSTLHIALMGDIVVVDEADHQGSKTITIKRLAEDGTLVTEQVETGGPRGCITVHEGEDTQLKCVILAGGEGGDLRVPYFKGFVDGTGTSNFAYRHISSAADLDEDGEVSRVEGITYLVALAMEDPTAAMEQFESADADADGAVTTEEAEKFLAAAPFMMIVKEAAEASDREEQKVELKISTGATVPEMGAWWVTENISAEPHGEQVADEAVPQCLALGHGQARAMFIGGGPDDKSLEIDVRIETGEDGDRKILITRDGEEIDLAELESTEGADLLIARNILVRCLRLGDRDGQEAQVQVLVNVEEDKEEVAGDQEEEVAY